jgi:hypothetical protein
MCLSSFHVLPMCLFSSDYFSAAATLETKVVSQGQHHHDDNKNFLMLPVFCRSP